VNITADFEHLVPDTMLDLVEQSTGLKLTGLATPLPSYINRVYEIETNDGERLITKFYRPGRWSFEALKEEHDFMIDCAEAEIPVIAPKIVSGDKTLFDAGGIYFTIFPKRFGRQLEINTDEDWLRVGRLLGRVHTVGSQRESKARTVLHPGRSIAEHVKHLIENKFVTPRHAESFKDVTSRILETISPLFEDLEFIRIHGDCHCGNLLDRPGEGIMIIDFDDMMVGPPIQDLWLLLPDRADKARRELDLLLQGYEQFREFDNPSIRLIEPLRAMRIIYYLSWCSRQVNDFKFRTNHPEWGTDAFWQREVSDLLIQLQVIEEHLE